jgi:hypothetical protein
VGTTTVKKPTVVKSAGKQVLPYSLNPVALSQEKTISTTEWSAAFLTLIKAPVTPNNIVNVETWLHNEQSAGSWNADATNPLGVEQGGKVTSQGNVLQGLLLTSSTLASYPTIVNALRKDAPTAVFSSAVVNSPWNTGKSGTGKYGGKTVSQFQALGPLQTGKITNNSLAADVSQDEIPVVSGAGSVVAAVTGTSAPGSGGLSTIESDLSSSSFWKRIGVGALGVGLAITGIILFVATSKTGEKTINAGEKAGMLAA